MSYTSGHAQSFNVGVATAFGVNAAIILNIIRSVIHNNLKKQHLYCSTQGYLTEEEVDVALKVLEANGIIKIKFENISLVGGE